MPLQMRSLVIPTLRRAALSQLERHYSFLIEDVFHNLSAVMPVSDDSEIFDTLRILTSTKPWVTSSATAQFLKLAMYLLSNKLFDFDHQTILQVNDALFSWFKMDHNHLLLRSILSSKIPTIDAFAEGLFHSALRAEDLAFSKMFLELGLNPDIILLHIRSIIVRGGEPFDREDISSTPLQMMVKRGNIRIIELLLNFGADINHPLLTDQNERKSALQLAAKAGNVEIAALLISKGAIVNVATEWSLTPLQAALRADDIEMVRLLLNARADPNLSGNGEGLARQAGVTSGRWFVECPLWWALTRGRTDLVDILVDHGAVIDPRDASRVDSALSIASRIGDEDKARYLLQQGADVNAPACDWDGRTALQAAAEWGHLEGCQLLIQAGADTNAAPAPSPTFRADNGTIGVTALIAAVHSGNITLVKLLIDSGADVNATIPGHLYPTMRTALTLATSRNQIDIVRQLIRAGADAGRDDSIKFAGGEQQAELIPLLLSAGADIAIQMENGSNLVHCAVITEDLDLIQHLIGLGAHPGPHSLPRAAFMGNFEIVQFLISAGADINAFGSVEDTPDDSDTEINALQAAIFNGHNDLAMYLIDQDEDGNWQGNGHSGYTTLQVAIISRNFGLAKLLITRGADINAPAAPCIGLTALTASVEVGDPLFVRLLLEAGAKVDDEPAGDDGHTALQLAALYGSNTLIDILLEYGAEINGPIARSNRGCAALQLAVEGGHYQTVQKLLLGGAHVNAISQNEDNATALQAAAEKGYLRIAKALIHAGADINATGNRADEPALVFAAKNGRLDMLKLLLNAGADIETVNGRCQLKKALDYAIQRGHDAAAKFLECHQVSRSNVQR